MWTPDEVKMCARCSETWLSSTESTMLSSLNSERHELFRIKDNFHCVTQTLISAMVSDSIALAFIVLIESWASQVKLGPASLYLWLERLEVLAEMGAEIVRRLGESQISAAFSDVWVYVRRAMCALSGMNFNRTLTITAASIANVPFQQRGLHALRELPRVILLQEIVDQNLTLVEELASISNPGSDVGNL